MGESIQHAHAVGALDSSREVPIFREVAVPEGSLWWVALLPLKLVQPIDSYDP